jgi:hypothetical protein
MALKIKQGLISTLEKLAYNLSYALSFSPLTNSQLGPDVADL